jgi:hypothetical protein
MQKLETRPLSFISGTICIEFSVQCNFAALQTHLLVVEVHYDNLGVGHARNVPYVARPGGREVTFALSQVQQAAAQEKVKVKVNDENVID